jgi:hypothetical protein
MDGVVASRVEVSRKWEAGPRDRRRNGVRLLVLLVLL